MTRAKSETIGHYGRLPARTTKQPYEPPTGAGSPPPRPSNRVREAIRGFVRGALFDNLGLKFLSVVLAVTVFLLVNTDRDREITALVKVSYALPEDRVLVSPRLNEINVVIRGPWRRLRHFDDREIERVNIDLSRGQTGEIPLADLVHLPTGLSLVSTNPPSTSVAFERRIDKVVEVSPQVIGHPRHGYVTTGVKLSPATVKVRGAEGIVASLANLPTVKLDLDDRDESFDAEVALAQREGVEVVGGGPFTLHVTIEEQLVSRKVLGVAVTLRGDGTVDATKWAIAPTQVDVTLTGTLLAVERAKDQLAPIVKVLVTDTKAREADIVLDGLPPGVGAKISPERVRVAPVAPPKPTEK